MIKGKKNSKSEDRATGKYRRKEPPPQVADYMQCSSGIVRHPTAVKRSEHVVTGPGSNKSIRSLSVPSLHATADKVRYSPPPSPSKPRSKSVRVNAAKKASSFKKNFKKLFGSHLELDENGTGLDEQHVVGTYRPLVARPRSIGGSSDCSNSSTYTNDFARCNSLRDSGRSRVSHGGNDSVFQGRQLSCDSTDNNYPPMHMASGSTDSTLRQAQPVYGQYRGGGENMQRSSSSTSLKTFGIQTKIGVTDPRYHSVATEVPFLEEHGNRRLHRHIAVGRQGMSFEDADSLWEDSKSFTFMNKSSVHPSDPQYRRIAEELMSVSPTHKNASEYQFPLDPRRISEASIGPRDPRRGSLDSEGMETLATVKRNRSLPSTPITKTFAMANGDMSSMQQQSSMGPQGFLSEESIQSTLPLDWEIAYTEQGLRYYLDHSTQSTHWELPEPEDHNNKIGLPSGWEAVKSGQYGTYYVNHNEKTAIYQHPYHVRPPPPYQRPEEEDVKGSKSDRKAPARSHSHRSQSHRIQDPHSSLLRRSKSVRDQEVQNSTAHERQLSVVTFVPPSPYQSKEIPQWLKKYVGAPSDSELDSEMEAALRNHTYDDLTGWDTMIKRLLKKGSEHIVKAYEYYRVAIQQEMEDRLRERRQCAFLHRQQQQQQMFSSGGEGQSLGDPSSHHHYYPPQPGVVHPSYYHYPSTATTTAATGHAPSSSPSTTHMAALYAHHQPHPLHSDLPPPPVGNGHRQFSPSGAVHHQVPPTSPLSPQQLAGPPPPPPHHHQATPIGHAHPLPASFYHPHINNSNNSSNDEMGRMVARYDTMIEKKSHADTTPPISAYSNGLRRVDSEGVTGSTQSNKGHGGKGFSFRTVSADHVGRQGGNNFSELFETSQNVQETFV